EKKQKRQAKKVVKREQPKPEPQGPTAREIIQANPHVANQLRSVIPVTQEKAEIRQKREAELAEQRQRAEQEAASQQDAAAREHEQRKREQQQRAEQAERELAERIERAHRLPDDATFKDYL